MLGEVVCPVGLDEEVDTVLQRGLVSGDVVFATFVVLVLIIVHHVLVASGGRTRLCCGLK